MPILKSLLARFFDRFKSAGRPSLPVISCDADQSARDAFRLVNDGNVFEDQGRLDEAMQCYEAAIRIAPTLGRAHLNRGNVLLAKNDGEGAVEAYLTALADNPEYASAHFNLGNAYLHLNHSKAALSAYNAALALKPDFVDAEVARGIALDDLGELAMSAASSRRVLELKPDYTQAHSNLLFSHNYRADRPASLLLEDASAYGKLVGQLARPHKVWTNDPNPERCLRVGFVSDDLRKHPVGYFLEAVVAALAAKCSDRVELFAYPGRLALDVVSQRIKAHCRGWHPTVGASDEALARKIREDGIDILVDLSGHTAGNRLPMFAWKPAPVQVSWLGYFATTGVSAIDYLIADHWTAPVTEEVNFTEKLWRLPETRLCFTAPEERVDVGPLPARGAGHITFGCFNNLTKMNASVVALWSRVLLAVPHSQLYLKAKQLTESSIRDNVLQRFSVHGIGANRLMMEGQTSRADYLKAYQRVDIGLDPFPFPGGTTTVEALWMGVPVLTLSSDRFLSRQGVGLLMNAGLSEWIAADADDYVARAVSHASNSNQLALLRSTLRRDILASPIFNAPRFAEHFEYALRCMWRKWTSAQTPVSVR